MKKKISAIFISLVVVLSLLTQSIFAVELLFDGEPLITDVPPQIVDGRTLVPMRAIFEAFGAVVEWDNDTRTATAHKDGLEMALTLGSTTAYVNGEARELDVPALSIEGRTMVPVRFVSETLHAEVLWEEETRTVQVITSTGSNNNGSQGIKTEGTYIGSIDSDKYHYPTCRHAKTILSKNETWFDTVEEAKANGYSPCGVCKPR